MKDYYAILRADPRATAEELKKQFRLLASMYHPDRFHPTTQKAQWEEANRMTTELNEAYNTLKSPESRARYDRELRASRAAKEEPQPARRSADPRPEAQQAHRAPIDPDPKRVYGSIPWRDVPPALIERLKARHARSEDHVRVSTERILPIAGLVLAPLLWAPLLFEMARLVRWSSGVQQIQVIVTAAAALVFGTGVYRLLRHLSAPLRPAVYVTPLYAFHATHKGLSVWDWSGFLGIRHTRVRGGHRVHLSMAGESISFLLRSDHEKERLQRTFELADQRIRAALQGVDAGYIQRQDDLQSWEPAHAPAKPARVPRTMLGSAGLALASACALLFAAVQVNQTAPVPPATGVVTAQDVLNVRAGADESSAVVAQLLTRTPIEILGPAIGDFLPVRHAEGEGYVHASFVTPTPSLLSSLDRLYPSALGITRPRTSPEDASRPEDAVREAAAPTSAPEVRKAKPNATPQPVASRPPVEFVSLSTLRAHFEADQPTEESRCRSEALIELFERIENERVSGAPQEIAGGRDCEFSRVMLGWDPPYRLRLTQRQNGSQVVIYQKDWQ